MLDMLGNVSTGERKPIKVLLRAVGILTVSGATAGLLGIGGALIFNPYLLQLGMDPRVSTTLQSYTLVVPLQSLAMQCVQRC